jgi:hypothetical protein
MCGLAVAQEVLGHGGAGAGPGAAGPPGRARAGDRARVGLSLPPTPPLGRRRLAALSSDYDHRLSMLVQGGNYLPNRSRIKRQCVIYRAE